MKDISRRDFLIKAGAAAVTYPLWSNALFTACNKEGTNVMEEGIFGFEKEKLRKILDKALSKGGEFADLYFEREISNSVNMEEEIIKSSSQSVSLGVGVRVIKGKQTGYAYTNELTEEKLMEAALTAAAIAKSGGKFQIANLKVIKPKAQVYDMKNVYSDAALEEKIKIIKRTYNSAKKHDEKIKKVSVGLADSLQTVSIVNSDGLIVTDRRPQFRLMARATAVSDGKRGTGVYNDGGRAGMTNKQFKSPEEIGERAAKESIILLDAVNPPTGEQPVVLSKEQSGVMIHEAVGHPLEADANWKKQSIMHDRMGETVANPIVTIYDDATIPYLRGSLNVDDEGTPTEKVSLIENGKLVGFLQDNLSGKIMNKKSNGHGRRQSYEYPAIPRMNNTVLGRGETNPEEILESVKKGFYAVSYQGGQVFNTGKFTFSINLGYMIENGKLTRPVKNATLIGTNVQILNNISMIGNDMGFFLGTCGKAGQAVPVTCGTPTMKIDKMTVGGMS